MLPLPQHQNDSGSSKNNTPNVTDDLNITRAKLTQRVFKEKQAIDRKVIETTSTFVFPITNDIFGVKNIENADNNVLKNKFEDVYHTIGHWRKSLFLLPSGSRGKSFIEEMKRHVNSLTFTSEQDTTVMKALMVLPTLLLQKPSFISK